MSVTRGGLEQGILTDEEGSVDLLIMVAYFVKESK